MSTINVPKAFVTLFTPTEFSLLCGSVLEVLHKEIAGLQDKDTTSMRADFKDILALQSWACSQPPNSPIDLSQLFSQARSGAHFQHVLPLLFLAGGPGAKSRHLKVLTAVHRFGSPEQVQRVLVGLKENELGEEARAYLTLDSLSG